MIEQTNNHEDVHMQPRYNAIVEKTNKALALGEFSKAIELIKSLDRDTINDTDNAHAFYGKRIIDCAVMFGTAEIVRMVCDMGATLNQSTGNSDKYPVHYLIDRNIKMTRAEIAVQFEILDVLDQFGADFNLKSYGSSLAHMAVEKNKFYLLPFLVSELKCDINIANSDGKLPLTLIHEKFGTKSEKAIYAKNELGAKVNTKETQELYDRFNAGVKKPAKRERIYGRNQFAEWVQASIKWAADNHIYDEEETPASNDVEVSSSSATTTMTAQSIFAPSKQAVEFSGNDLKTLINVIKNGGPDKMFQMYVSKLQNQINPDRYLDEILNACGTPKKFPERIETLKALRTDNSDKMKICS